jgi:hypothetical protein
MTTRKLKIRGCATDSKSTCHCTWSTERSSVPRTGSASHARGCATDSKSTCHCTRSTERSSVPRVGSASPRPRLRHGLQEHVPLAPGVRSAAPCHASAQRVHARGYATDSKRTSHCTWSTGRKLRAPHRRSEPPRPRLRHGLQEPAPLHLEYRAQLRAPRRLSEPMPAATPRTPRAAAAQGTRPGRTEPATPSLANQQPLAPSP